MVFCPGRRCRCEDGRSAKGLVWADFSSWFDILHYNQYDSVNSDSTTLNVLNSASGTASMKMVRSTWG